MTNTSALSNVRILDLSRFIAGPYCTRILAGSGAEVVKIEKPGSGDQARHIPPFLDDIPGLERSGLFLYLNTNKKSITLNLKSETGAGILKELVKDADVVVENFRPGKIDELGLGFSVLNEINPRLVMTSMSNFGQTGFYRDYKMNHLTAWGMSGARYNDGAPGVRPVQIGGWLTHYITGLFAATGTLTAVYQSRATGKGCHVDTSMWESNILVTCYPTVIYSYNGLEHNGISKERFGIFECKDGYIGLNLYGRLNWEMLCTFLGMPELVTDTRFSTPQALFEHYEEARSIVAEKVRQREKMELFQSGVEWRIPFGLVPTTQEILESPQHQARGFFEQTNHPVMGQVTMPGAPFKMGGTPWRMENPAPLLGQHNREIYCDRLGYSPEDLIRMRERGVI
jgi:crotonobetainyl-CoA:carnitine CoA-transferase CaiB-like acyl-CoA transferase